MDRKINQEIRQYSAGVFWGLSLREILFIMGGGIAAGIVFMLCRGKFPVDILTMLCALAGLPIAAGGFVKYNGLYLWPLIRLACRALILRSHARIFIADNFLWKWIHGNEAAAKSNRRRVLSSGKKKKGGMTHVEQ